MKNMCIFMAVFFLCFTSMAATPVFAKKTPPSGDLTQKYVSYKGISLYTEAYNYASCKTKEAVLYLHGLGGSHSDAAFLYDSENTYMTISMDMPNHGGSGALSVNDITWNNCLGAVKAVIDAYGLKEVKLVGHSMGADMAMMYAKKYPKDVKELVLLDRSYYNYSDMAQFNFTKEFLKVVEYNPASGLGYDAFCKYLDLIYLNDITKTWDIKSDVLLLAANPYWPKPAEGEMSIVDVIALMKQYPEAFGLTPEQAASLPDLTLQNLNDYMDELALKISEFDSHNKRFFTFQTPYEHAMVYNDLAKDNLRGYVLEYFNNGEKGLAVEKIKCDSKRKDKNYKNDIIPDDWKERVKSVQARVKR